MERSVVARRLAAAPAPGEIDGLPALLQRVALLPWIGSGAAWLRDGP